jgi:predicted transcriptional regulator
MNSATDLTWRDILPFLLLALALSAGLHLLAGLLAPAGMAFTGGLVNHADVSVYLAALRQGAAGEWLYNIQFAPEPWQPVLMYPLYMALGKLLPAVDGSYRLVYDLLRVVGVLFAGTAIWVWVREVFPGRKRLQLTGWLLIVFSSGFGWLVWTLAGAAIDNLFFRLPDVGRSELSFITMTLAAPHFMLGLGLEVFLFICIIRLARPAAERLRVGLKWAIIALVLALALVFTYVYHLATIGLIIGLYLLQQAGQRRKIPWRLWLYGAIVLLPLLPFLYYYGFQVNQDPVWAAYLISPEFAIPAPALWALAIGLGLPGLLAVFGTPRWLRDRAEPFVLIWLVGNLLVLYLPTIAYAGRFLLGLIVPVGTLAAYGLETVLLPWWKANAGPRVSSASARRIVVWLVVPGTLFIILLRLASAVQTPDHPFYIPEAELAAMHWLSGELKDDDLVLAHFPASNYLPAVSPGRVFAGQVYLTPDLPGKLDQLARFWHEETSATERQAIIDTWSIDYLYYGRYEQEITTGRVNPPGEQIYAGDGVTIYRLP